MRSRRTRLLLRGSFISAANREFRGDDAGAAHFEFESRRYSRVQHVTVHAHVNARRVVRVGAQRSTKLRVATRAVHRDEKAVAPTQHDTSPCVPHSSPAPRRVAAGLHNALFGTMRRAVDGFRSPIRLARRFVSAYAG